ncbi:hypothetical protein T09_8659 [Trichinella sp. T9]|nr:hypothetical protein T09_8659 [Trichinella sp. T9]
MFFIHLYPIGCPGSENRTLGGQYHCSHKLVGKHGSVLWAIQTITDTLIIIENFTFTKNFKKMIFCAANARNLRSTIHFIRILIENKLNIQRLADNMAKVIDLSSSFQCAFDFFNNEDLYVINAFHYMVYAAVLESTQFNELMKSRDFILWLVAVL